MSNIGPILMSVLPSVGLAVIFWYVMRAVIRADRREREELARIDAEDAARAAAQAAQKQPPAPSE